MSNYEFIEAQQTSPANTNPVTKMWRWLTVSTFGFHHWATRPQPTAVIRRAELAVRIKNYFQDIDQSYGYRRIHTDLTAEGTKCSPDRVPQIMRVEELVPCRPRIFLITTDADADVASKIPDMMKRDFTVTKTGI